MSFYRAGAFWLGILVFVWVGYLYISGNRTLKQDAPEAIYEQNKNNPLFMKRMENSIFYSQTEAKNLSDYHYKRLKSIVDKKMPEYSEKKFKVFKQLVAVQQKINRVEVLFKSLKEVKIPSEKEVITFSCGFVVFDTDNIQGVLNIFKDHKLVKDFKADFMQASQEVKYSDMHIWLKVTNLPLFHTTIFVSKRDKTKIEEIAKLLHEIQATRIG